MAEEQGNAPSPHDTGPWGGARKRNGLACKGRTVCFTQLQLLVISIFCNYETLHSILAKDVLIICLCQVYDARNLQLVKSEPEASTTFVSNVAFAEDETRVMGVGGDANCYVMELQDKPAARYASTG